MTAARTLWRHARLATMTIDSPWGWVEDGALLTEGDRIVWVGPDADVRQDGPVQTDRKSVV